MMRSPPAPARGVVRRLALPQNRIDPDREAGIEAVLGGVEAAMGLDQLLAESDFIVATADLNPSTKGRFDAAAFRDFALARKPTGAGRDTTPAAPVIVAFISANYPCR